MDLSPTLDTIISKTIAEKKIVGLVVSVLQDGKTLYQKAAGYADREKQIPMQNNTLFRLSSVTKPFITAAIGVLLDQNKLSLNDAVTKWLPYFTPALPHGEPPEITIGHLLSHTAGLNYAFNEASDGPYHQAHISDGLDISGLSLTDNLKRIASVPLLYQPGTSMQYSVATDVLGAVIAEVCNNSLPDAINHLVMQPLDIKQTHFSLAKSERARLATAYANADPEPKVMANNQEIMGICFSPDRIFDEHEFASGGAGMIGPLSDVVRLLEVFRTGGQPLFSETTMNLLREDKSGSVEPNPGWGFASSWMVLRDPQQAHTPQSIGTIFWGGVYGHTWFIDFEKGLTVVILTNTAPEGLIGSLNQEITDAIYAAL